MRRWGRCLPPLIPMSLTLELRSWPARQHRALLLPYANQTVNSAQKREGGSQRGESFSVGYSSQHSPIITWDNVPGLLSSTLSEYLKCHPGPEKVDHIGA